MRVLLSVLPIPQPLMPSSSTGATSGGEGTLGRTMSPAVPGWGQEMDHKMACMAFRGPTAENGRIVTLGLSDS